MCFGSTKYAKARIAKTDIECFKFLENGRGYYSPFQDFSYKKGVVTELVKISKNKDNYNIYQGYHSFRSTLRLKDAWNYNTYSHKICRFIIPAGTRYYSNMDGEYVSEQIILVEPIKS